MMQGQDAGPRRARHIRRYHRSGRHVILIGHKGHPEVTGTTGHVPSGGMTVVRTASDVLQLEVGPSAPLGYAVQTTYSIEEANEVVQALERRFDDLQGPSSSDICYAPPIAKLLSAK